MTCIASWHILTTIKKSLNQALYCWHKRSDSYNHWRNWPYNQLMFNVVSRSAWSLCSISFLVLCCCLVWGLYCSSNFECWSYMRLKTLLPNDINLSASICYFLLSSKAFQSSPGVYATLANIVLTQKKENVLFMWGILVIYVNFCYCMFYKYLQIDNNVSNTAVFLYATCSSSCYCSDFVLGCKP